jgi:hypothetical protein
MFGELFKTIGSIAEDTVKIGLAPIQIAAQVTHSVTRPIAKIADEIVEDVKEELNED